jgi:hypothetical protein
MRRKIAVLAQQTKGRQRSHSGRCAHLTFLPLFSAASRSASLDHPTLWPQKPNLDRLIKKDADLPSKLVRTVGLLKEGNSTPYHGTEGVCLRCITRREDCRQPRFEI